MTAPATMSERASPRHGGWRSRLARTLVVATMGLLALITLAPTLGRLAAAHLATRRLGTPVQVAWLGLEFKPLTITASGITIGPDRGPRAAAVRVGLDPTRLWRGDFAPQQIVIERLRLHAEVGNHGFIVTGVTPELLGLAAATPPAMNDAATSRENRASPPSVELGDARLVLRWPESDLAPLDLRFNRLDLRDGIVRGSGQVVALGGQAPRPARITDLRWTLSPAGRFAAHLTDPDRSGRLGIEGRIHPTRGSLDLVLAFDGFPAALLASFVRPGTRALPPHTSSITGRTRVDVGPGRAEVRSELFGSDGAPDVRAELRPADRETRDPLGSTPPGD